MDLDLLIAHKFTLLYLQDKLTLDLVLHAPDTGALKFWSKGLEIDHLVNFHTTRIASIDRHLHTWLDVAAPRYDSLDSDQGTNLVRLDLAHFVVVLLSVDARYDDQVVLAL